MSQFTYLKCSVCGWVHFAVTREFAEAEVERFNNYYSKLTPQQQEDYYGSKLANIEIYSRCFHCRSPHTAAQVCSDSAVPVGSTIQPLIKD